MSVNVRLNVPKLENPTSMQISVTVRAVVRRKLEKHDLAVLEAPDAKEALERIRGDQPDLVLLDLGLPDRDGLRVLADVRLESSVPVIIVTGRTAEFDQLRGLELGADDYVTKPVSLMELEARIHAVLRRTSLLASH